MTDLLFALMQWFTKPLVRLSLLALTVLSLQTTFFADTSVSGVHGQVMLLLAACCGVAVGIERGAIAGFIIGFMYDLVLTTPFGVSAVTMAVVAASAGLVKTFLMDPPWWVNWLTVAGASALGEVVFPMAQNIVGDEGWMQVRVIKVALIVAAINLLLAPLGLRLARWAFKLAPARP